MATPTNPPTEAEGMEIFYQVLAEAIATNDTVKAALAQALSESPCREVIEGICDERIAAAGGS